MAYKIDGRTFNDYDEAVKYVNKYKRYINEPEEYVTYNEVKIECPRKNLAKLKSRIAISVDPKLKRSEKVMNYMQTEEGTKPIGDDEYKSLTKYINTGEKLRPKVAPIKNKKQFAQLNDRIDSKLHKHSIQFRQAKQGEVGEFKGATQDKYWKYWLLTAKSTNGNNWGVSADSIDKNIHKFVGKPFCVTAKQWFPESEYETYEHPYLPTNNLDIIFSHQAKYAVGNIVDIIKEKDDYYAMIKPNTKFASMSPPAFCSPAIFQLDPREKENSISKWEALHLAGLDRDPAYGAQVALLKGTCIGTANECKVQFKGAKQMNAGRFDPEEPNEYGDTPEQARARELITTLQKNRKLTKAMNSEEGRKANKLYVDKGVRINPKEHLDDLKRRMAKQRLAAIYNVGESPQVNINPEHGKRIADAYGSMKHEPENPEVQRAYSALINETKGQFTDLLGKGLKIDKIPSGTNPYPTSREMHEDIEKNNHLYYFPTEEGYGDNEQAKNHPMLQETEFKHEGKSLLANDVFRIVHDVNGHHIGGKSGFGPKGEHQAYLTHKKMYSPLANKALFSETAGQNNYVNFGPHGEQNRKDPKNTIYAEQKAGLMSDDIINGVYHQ